MAMFSKKGSKSSANDAEVDVSQKTELEKDGEKHFEKNPAPSGFQNFFVSFTLLFGHLNSADVEFPPASNILWHKIRLFPNWAMCFHGCGGRSGMFSAIYDLRTVIHTFQAMPLMFVVLGNLVGNFTGYFTPGSSVTRGQFEDALNTQTYDSGMELNTEKCV